MEQQLVAFLELNQLSQIMEMLQEIEVGYMFYDCSTILLE